MVDPVRSVPARSAFTIGDIGDGAVVAQGEHITIGGEPARWVGDPPVDYRMANRLVPSLGLVGRLSELERLVAFAQGPPGVLLIEGTAWAGKTALLAAFVSEPPADVDVISFFVRETTAQHDDQSFLVAVNGQMISLLDVNFGIPRDPISRRSQFGMLWTAACEQAGLTGRPLVLVVDAIDEEADTGISPLIPAPEVARGHVVISTRPGVRPKRLGDILSFDTLHLSPSEIGTTTRRLAAETLRGALVDADDLSRDVVAVLTEASGRLRACDVAEILGREPLDAYRALGPLDRILLGDLDAQGVELGHVDLARSARELLGPARLVGAVAAIGAWADRYQEEGWPPDTPVYLLTELSRFHSTRGDTSALAALITTSRRRRQFATTGALTDFRADVAAAKVALDGAHQFPELLRIAVHETDAELALREVPYELLNALCFFDPNRAIALATSGWSDSFGLSQLLAVVSEYDPVLAADKLRLVAENDRAVVCATLVPRLASVDPSRALQLLDGLDSQCLKIRLVYSTVIEAPSLEDDLEIRLRALAADFSIDHECEFHAPLTCATVLASLLTGVEGIDAVAVARDAKQVWLTTLSSRALSAESLAELAMIAPLAPLDEAEWAFVRGEIDEVLADRSPVERAALRVDLATRFAEVPSADSNYWLAAAVADLDAAEWSPRRSVVDACFAGAAIALGVTTAEDARARVQRDLVAAGDAVAGGRIPDLVDLGGFAAALVDLDRDSAVRLADSIVTAAESLDEFCRRAVTAPLAISWRECLPEEARGAADVFCGSGLYDEDIVSHYDVASLVGLASDEGRTMVRDQVLDVLQQLPMRDERIRGEVSGQLAAVVYSALAKNADLRRAVLNASPGQDPWSAAALVLIAAAAAGEIGNDAGRAVAAAREVSASLDRIRADRAARSRAGHQIIGAPDMPASSGLELLADVTVFAALSGTDDDSARLDSLLARIQVTDDEEGLDGGWLLALLVETLDSLRPSLLVDLAAELLDRGPETCDEQTVLRIASHIIRAANADGRTADPDLIAYVHSYVDAIVQVLEPDDDDGSAPFAAVELALQAVLVLARVDAERASMLASQATSLLVEMTPGIDVPALTLVVELATVAGALAKHADVVPGFAALTSQLCARASDVLRGAEEPAGQCWPRGSEIDVASAYAALAAATLGGDASEAARLVGEAHRLLEALQIGFDPNDVADPWAEPGDDTQKWRGLRLIMATGPLGLIRLEPPLRALAAVDVEAAFAIARHLDPSPTSTYLVAIMAGEAVTRLGDYRGLAEVLLSDFERSVLEPARLAATGIAANTTSAGGR